VIIPLLWLLSKALARDRPTTLQTALFLCLIGGFSYGATFAGISVSGPTYPFAIPASLAIISLGVWRLLSKKKLGAAGMIFIPGYMFGLILIFVFRAFCFFCVHNF